ncbi:MAG: carbonic anhydrase family protein [Pseudomonadota bacterium]|nr:carbonic anhydrase family protein [Pseudomonadota bacterium]
MRRTFSSSFKNCVVAPLLIMIVVSLFMMTANAAEKTLQKSDVPLLDLGSEIESLKDKEKHDKPVTAPIVNPISESHSSRVMPKVKPDLHGDDKPHWSYSGGTGPKHWGELSPEFSTCKTGKNQSPIDLRDKAALGTQGLASLDIAYKEVPLKIINNGHSIQVNFPLGSYIKVGGHRYELMQYHFHTPSEHYKEGFPYPMEMHLVHKDGDGNLAVMGVLFQEGEENEYLNGLLKRLPKEIGKQQIYNDLQLNPVHFLPANTEFYKYSGSLTTPPCSEGVYWMVFKHPIEASAEQIIKMNELMGENARPVQPMFSRHVLKSWNEPDEGSQLYEFY